MISSLPTIFGRAGLLVSCSTGAPPGTAYLLRFTGENSLISALYLGGGDEIANTTRFNALASQRKAIEDRYGGLLEFDSIDGKTASKILDSRPGSIDN